MILIANTEQGHHRKQRVDKHVTRPGARVHRVCGVEVDQGGVAGRGRSTAANWHQLKQISSKWINILKIGNVTFFSNFDIPLFRTQFCVSSIMKS